ncbi:Heavy metal transport/detoxification superfamily protein [Rhynchospora pubera]|uniref:Heavy metal transport/detoxification superfamily protein n=1 Tax=Rhynchospora pubera TaxID=906938 RepID=A0AAV8D8L0_9POAL|nr:Heavy metal transport/detoxification superfamily protein [Rhynchospora pubera]
MIASFLATYIILNSQVGCLFLISIFSQSSTLILKVDLDCHLCYKKIKKVLCRLQEKEDIKAIIYDEKAKTIMIAGPFNPDKVSNWLCCRACKIIKEIEIKDNKPKDKPKDSKPADDAKPKNDKPKDDKGQNGKPKDEKPKNDKAKDGKPKDEKSKGDKGKNGKPDADSPKEDKPKAEKPKKSVEFDLKPIPIPQKAQLEPLRNEFGVVGGYPQMSYQPGWPVGPVGAVSPMVPAAPSCCFRPLYEGFYGGYRCCTCGTVHGYGVAAPPVGYYGGPTSHDPYKGSQFFCEEEPSCSIM